MTASPVILGRMAWRNVLRNPRRSLVTAFAIIFGLICLLVFQALKVGLHDTMIASTVNLETGSLQIQAAGYESQTSGLHPLPESPKAIQALKRLPDIAFSQRLQVPAMVLAGRHTSTLILTGIDPNREKQVTDLSRKVKEGNYLAEGEGILIGATLAEALKVGLGDSINLMAQSLFGQPVTQPFTVSGIFATELSTFDRSHVYLTLAQTRDFLQAEGLSTALAVVAPRGEEERIAHTLQQFLPEDKYQVRTWRDLAPDLVQLIELNDATMNLLIIILFFIVGLGIVNTMSTVVYERFPEWGILLAIGIRPNRILVLVVFEACIIGLLASAIGSLAGLAACSWLAEYGLDLTTFTSNNQYLAMTHVIKARLIASDFWLANLITLLVALLAGLFPAWRASRLQPVDALRHL